MSKPKKTPGAVLQALIAQYQINPFFVSQKTNINYHTLRSIIFSNGNVSISTSLRLAKFFGQTPDFWLDLQRTVDLEEAAADKNLQKDLSKIKKVEKPTEKPVSKKSQAKARKKNTLNDRRKRASRTPGSKHVSRKKKR